MREQRRPRAVTRRGVWHRPRLADELHRTLQRRAIVGSRRYDGEQTDLSIESGTSSKGTPRTRNASRCMAAGATPSATGPADPRAQARHLRAGALRPDGHNPAIVFIGVSTARRVTTAFAACTTRITRLRGGSQ